MPSEETVPRRVGGRYRLVERLGQGGMGTVWRGQDELLQRPVAVKQVAVPASLAGTDRESARSRVMREARAAARMSHPASVTVFDVLEDDGSIYIVMELLPTRTLAAVVEEEGPVPAERAADLGIKLAGVLEAAHARGIVHRDVKPSNVMVLPDGSVKLTDFGVASVTDDPAITATGQVLGSPSYMAPEQAQGERSGPAADWWGLGATLYHAVEGRPPFEREGALPTLTAVVNEEPETPVRAGPLAPVIAQLLAKDPAMRPAGEAVRRQLAAVAGGAPVSPRPRHADATDELTVVAPVPRPVGHQAPPTPAPGPPAHEDRPDAPPPPTPAAPPPPAGAPPAPGPRPPPDVPASAAPTAVRAALVALVVLAVLVAGVQLARLAGGSGDEETGAPTTAASAPTTAPGEPTTAATGPRRAATTTTAAAAAAAVPADWVDYTDPKTGYRVAHPPTWQVRPVDATRTDIRDPDTGAYLRVDWTDEPGPSPEGAWRAQAARFAATHEGYQEIRIEPTTYKGFDAAIWEFTYSSGGTRLHALDLGFVTGPYGFALYFQSSEELWAGLQPTFEAFKAGFRPPA